MVLGVAAVDGPTDAATITIANFFRHRDPDVRSRRASTWSSLRRSRSSSIDVVSQLVRSSFARRSSTSFRASRTCSTMCKTRRLIARECIVARRKRPRKRTIERKLQKFSKVSRTLFSIVRAECAAWRANFAVVDNHRIERLSVESRDVVPATS